MTAREASCGGCGETDPAKRCLGCLADFRPAQQDSQQGAGGEGPDICRDAMTVDELIACAKANAAQMHPLNNLRDLLEQMSAALSRHPSGHTGGPVADEAPYGWVYESFKPGPGWCAPDEWWPAEFTRKSPNPANTRNVIALYARPAPVEGSPAAQQDGGSGGGEAEQNVPCPDCGQMCVPGSTHQCPYRGRVSVPARSSPAALRLENATLELQEMIAKSDAHIDPTVTVQKWAALAILSALQSAHPASGAEDVGKYAGLLDQLDEYFQTNIKPTPYEDWSLEELLIARAGDAVRNLIRPALTPQDGAVAGEGEAND